MHTSDRGALMFRRVNEWLQGHEEFKDRPPQSYFPRVTLKVVETEKEEFFGQVEDTDLVVLADVLNENGQTIEGKVDQGRDEVVLHEFMPMFHARQTPFGKGDLYRHQLLNSSAQPEVLRRFYNAQYAGVQGQASPTEDTVRFTRVSSLLNWQDLLDKQHRTFNWVVCYDTVVDRFLLKNTFPDTVQVIRYSMGLGPKQQHNLTVSSAARTQEMVVRRLRGRLYEMWPNIGEEQLLKIANRLVEEANELSGDIVLRAAGPGAFLNELIGLVSAKYLTERRYLEREENLGALTAWIYLDDYAHWFSGKYPDLVFVAASPRTDGRLDLHVEVVEAKCVSGTNYAQEASDADRQATQGVSRLSTAWTPKPNNGVGHLDAPYWYDQMVRAMVANLAVEGEQASSWDRFYRNLEEGNFELDMSGHAWAFCHDGQGTVPAGNKQEDGKTDLLPDEEPEHVVYYHHLSREGLHRTIRDLVGVELPGPTSVDEPEAVGGDYEQDQEVDHREQDLAQSAVKRHGSSVEQGIRSNGGPSATISERPEHLPVGSKGKPPEAGIDPEWLAQRGRDLDRVLHQFSIRAQSVDPELADVGPSIVRFKIRLKSGERLNRLQNVAEDIGRELALENTPIIANVPGSVYVGIDLPRSKPEMVPLLPLLDRLDAPAPGELPVILGQTPDGETLIEDLSDFPHLLVAGATNSGKSVFLRSLVLCLLKQHRPQDLRLLIVDPKRTDFTFFNRVSPYLMEGEVVTDQQKARDVLLDLVHNEMPRRQEVMAGRAFAIKDFNSSYPDEALPPIVAVIDEYAQLISIMSRSERDAFERDLMSLAAVARSTGIHLVLATQRPSHDVVTGTLRANLPASAAFKVANATNSRIVIDQGGAENLIGRGDMLFMRPSGTVLRLQAAFIGPADLDRFLRGMGY